MKRLLLFLFIGCVTARATAYTAAQDGNWNTASTWLPSGVPGSGDTAILAHHVVIPAAYTATIGVCPTNANALAGTATADLEILPGGALTVNTGAIYKLQGFQQHSGVYMATTNIPGFTMQTGSTLQIDECNGSVRFGLYAKAGSAGGYSSITVGTIADHWLTSNTVITSIRNGSANGIFWQDNGAYAMNTYNVYGVNFSNCGDAANRCAVWDLYAPNGSLESFNRFDQEHSFFANTGGLGGGKSGEMLNDNQAYLMIHGNVFTGTTFNNGDNSINTIGMSADMFTGDLVSPGHYELSDNFLDKGIGPDPAGGAGAVLSQWIIARNVINTWYVSGNNYPSGTGWVSFTGNVVRIPDCTSGMIFYGGGSNNYIYCDDSTDHYNPHVSGTPNGVQWQDMTFSGFIWDYGAAGTEGNCLGHAPSTSDHTYTVQIDHNIVVYGPNGIGACTLDDFGLTNIPNFENLYHNTAAGGISYGALFYVGETGSPTTQALSNFKSNIYFDSSARGNALGFAGQDTVMAANLINPSGLDFNTNWNYKAVTIWTGGHNSNCDPSTSQGTPYNICTEGGGAIGPHDVNVNPRMVNPAMNLRTWAAMRGQAGTADGAIAAFLASAILGPNAFGNLIANLFWNVRTGYSATNLAMKGKAHNGADIGAVQILVYNSIQ